MKEDGAVRFLSFHLTPYPPPSTPLAEIFLLGNKCDLENDVPEEKAERFAVEHGASRKYKVSAKTGTVGLSQPWAFGCCHQG